MAPEMGLCPPRGIQVKLSQYLIAAAIAATSVSSPAIAAPVPAATDAKGKILILVPLTLTKIADLDFGTVIPSAISGTVTINATTSARGSSKRAP